MPYLDRLPTPSLDDAVVVIDVPDDGPGFWAGGSSAVRDVAGAL
jgi:hypothetical protein